MKLEGLERLEKISTKRLIVRELLNNLGEGYYYTKYEIDINFALLIFTLFGDKEIHESMNAKDIDWVVFVDENYHLVEELKAGEYKDIIEDILAEVREGAEKKAKYNRSLAGAIEQIGNFFTEENLKKVKEAIDKAKEE